MLSFNLKFVKFNVMIFRDSESIQLNKTINKMWPMLDNFNIFFINLSNNLFSKNLF